MLIAHLSDSHISLGGPADAERLAALQACIDAINALEPQPDLVVHTGDVVHNGTPKEYEAAAAILNQLKAPLRVIPGNKDAREAMCKALPGACAQNASGFVESHDDHGDVRLIFLDSKSETSNKGVLSAERLQGLRDAAEHQGHTTLVFMHHPPFDVWTAPEPFQFEERSEADEVFSILEGHEARTMIVSGHIHRPWSEERGEISLRAVTALARDLRKGDALAEMATDAFYVLYDVSDDGEISSELRQVPVPD